jgi:hypothetical protein
LMMCSPWGGAKRHTPSLYPPPSTLHPVVDVDSIAIGAKIRPMQIRTIA